MGPYVLRSVSGHFKLWDESAKDSFDEAIVQAPPSSIPTINSACQCQPDTSSGCGSSTCSPCCANQLNMNHKCTPVGCDPSPTSYCKDDSSCCDAWTNEGCGTIPAGQPSTASNCNFGFQIQGHQCGDTASIQCVPDAACLQPGCQGQYTADPTLNLFCANGLVTPPTNLTQNAPITYVANCPATGATCQMYCVPPYVFNAAHNDCEIPPSGPPIQCLGYHVNTACYVPFPAGTTWAGYYQSQA